jgi:excisionase family DNA binding protein
MMASVMDQKLLYTISETCRLVSIGRTKLYELIGSGEIPLRKIGKKSLIAAADLKQWADRLPACRVPTETRGTEVERSVR